MSPVIFLSLDDVMEVHRRVIVEFGGDPERRDRGLLESAVTMAQATFGGQELHSKLSDKAGAYHFHLCANHASIDGHKRVAVAASELFLLINNQELAASDDEIEELTTGVAEGRISKEQVLEFYARYARAF